MTESGDTTLLETEMAPPAKDGSAVIRPAEVSDADAAWDLVASCRTALIERGITQWDTVYPSADTVRRDITNGTLFLLTTGVDCVGAVTLDANQDPSYASLQWQFEAPALVVHRLCVSPHLQGRGFGKRLMQFAEEHATGGGYGSIRLDAYSGNPSAVAFYQQRGYRRVGQLFFPRRELPFDLFEWKVPQADAR